MGVLMGQAESVLLLLWKPELNHISLSGWKRSGCHVNRWIWSSGRCELFDCCLRLVRSRSNSCLSMCSRSHLLPCHKTCPKSPLQSLTPTSLHLWVPAGAQTPGWCWPLALSRSDSRSHFGSLRLLPVPPLHPSIQEAVVCLGMLEQEH